MRGVGRLVVSWRLARVGWHLLSGLSTCAVIFPWLGEAARERRIQRWSAQLIAICGGRLRVCGGDEPAPPFRHALIVANHISWLDIFVINAMAPCRFIAKSEIRRWPVLGWLVAQAGTIFIARGNGRDLRRIFHGLVSAIHDGQRVAFFPEGTTAAQGQLLPFHPNLFEAAIDAKTVIAPYALRYLAADGTPHAAIEYVGETSFVQSLMTVLCGAPYTVELIVLPVIASDGVHRRELAQAAQRAIGEALGIAPTPA
jgi:1-acyl-sn-glycerol-3-phosphate acyltransferase